MLDGDDAIEQITNEHRQTTSRRQLQGNERFDGISPGVGLLDEDALDAAMRDDADETLSLLADMVGATDRKLRELARRMAGRIIVDLASGAPEQERGIGRLRSKAADETGGDLDLDASLDAIQLGRAAGTAPALDDLRVRRWTRPNRAVCLAIDRSGSMTGARLAAAAVAAASVIQRDEHQSVVLAFSDRVLVLKDEGQPRPVESVVNDVLRLRGFGPTDLGLVLRTAADRLARTGANRTRTILLSDCRVTLGTATEARDAAAALDELHIVAPADDSADARAFAAHVGARCEPLASPTDVVSVFERLAR